MKHFFFFTTRNQTKQEYGLKAVHEAWKNSRWHKLSTCLVWRILDIYFKNLDFKERVETYFLVKYQFQCVVCKQGKVEEHISHYNYPFNFNKSLFTSLEAIAQTLVTSKANCQYTKLLLFLLFCTCLSKPESAMNSSNQDLTLISWDL